MKKESFGNSRKRLGQKNLGTSGFEIPEISLAQLILEQFTVNKEQNSSPEKFNESALEARDASIKLLEQQLARQEDWVNYWKNKYEKCLEELKKETTRWWRF